MKWEVLKRYVAREVYTAVERNRDGVWDTILRDIVACDFKTKRGVDGDVVTVYANKAFDVIEGWDIRAVNRLRALFPWAFPKNLATGGLEIVDGDDGWRVERAPAGGQYE
jgi:hypothetical protein